MSIISFDFVTIIIIRNTVITVDTPQFFHSQQGFDGKYVMLTKADQNIEISANDL